MVKMVVDTNVVSEIRQLGASSALVEVFASTKPEELYLSVITVGEIVKGIERLPASKRRRDLESWLGELERAYADRILSIDIETARIWGEISGKNQLRGIQIPL